MKKILLLFLTSICTAEIINIPDANFKITTSIPEITSVTFEYFFHWHLFYPICW